MSIRNKAHHFKIRDIAYISNLDIRIPVDTHHPYSKNKTDTAKKTADNLWPKTSSKSAESNILEHCPMTPMAKQSASTDT